MLQNQDDDAEMGLKNYLAKFPHLTDKKLELFPGDPKERTWLSEVIQRKEPGCQKQSDEGFNPTSITFSSKSVSSFVK